MGCVMSTPAWPGAESVYRYLYRVLAKLGQAEWQAHRRSRKRTRFCPSADMRDLTRALDTGDENQLKGIQLNYKCRGWL